MDKVYESKFQFLTDLTDEELDALAARIGEIKTKRFNALWDDRINGVLSAIEELIKDCNAKHDGAFTVDASNYHDIELTWGDVYEAIKEEWLS